MLITVVSLFFIISHVFSQANIKNMIADDSGYVRISNIIKNTYKGDNSNNLLPQEYSNFLDQALTPEYLQKQVELGVDKYFAWLRGENVDLTLNFSELNARFPATMSFEGQSVDIPNPEMFSDIQLPVPSAQNRNITLSVYRLLEGKYLYALYVILFLSVLVVLLRFEIVDRLKWLFNIVYLPTLGFVLNLGLFYFLKTTSLLPKYFYSLFPDQYKDLLTGKIKFVLDQLFNLQLQIVLVSVSLTIITLIAYLVTKHYLTKVAEPEVTAGSVEVATPAVVAKPEESKNPQKPVPAVSK